ncbi:hypothetical protein [Curtobacterium sp. MCSS17_007]|uniref:hypothetical protein n=1 Tax=Curtobacterium sp. MCSS17_007 TaxID=2175646 RepID=UPI000DB07588|nr:hypothetical protein [Curtobacterium sp. MCSS17_007]WIE77043.1 hypothetical protein DEJ22_007250 [Curtobacterium sp. MCSS17_007]
MSSELWFVVASVAVVALAGVGHYFGWFTSKHGRGLPDGSGPTIQGSQATPPDLGGPGGHTG